jgi:hypothetical protein
MSGHICLLVLHNSYLDIGYGLLNTIFPVFVSNCCPRILLCLEFVIHEPMKSLSMKRKEKKCFIC